MSNETPQPDDSAVQASAAGGVDATAPIDGGPPAPASDEPADERARPGGADQEIEPGPDSLSGGLR